MGQRVDREMAQTRRGSDLETEATQQTHYIKWAKIFGIPDPCGYYEGFIRIVAIYIKYIQCGVNYDNKQFLCSATSETQFLGIPSFHPLAIIINYHRVVIYGYNQKNLFCS